MVRWGTTKIGNPSPKSGRLETRIALEAPNFRTFEQGLQNSHLGFCLLHRPAFVHGDLHGVGYLWPPVLCGD